MVKSAAETFATGLAKQISSEEFRVNASQVGTTDTDIHKSSGNLKRPAMIVATTPLGRDTTSDDIVAGEVLPISGGL